MNRLVVVAVALVSIAACSSDLSGDGEGANEGNTSATDGDIGATDGEGAEQEPDAEGSQGTAPIDETLPDDDTAGQDLPDDGDGTGGTTDGTSEASSLVSEGCIDGDYSEVLPTPEVSIEAEVQGYSAGAYMDFISTVLEKRYPLGAFLIENALLDQSMGHCVDAFLSQKNTAEQVIRSMSTLVHECGHFLDISTGGFFSDAYVINESLTLTCSGVSTPSNGGGKTFSRSLITGDEYSALWPPCASFGSGGECDSYAPIYLNGDPNDATFDSGDQGFGSVLEEVVQYVNSLATGYAFNDFYSVSTSERDGILTFLWYMQRYLRMARLDYPDTYNHLVGDSCWREAILTAWGRAWMFLLLTEEYPQLGLRDAILEPLALDPDLNAEIQRVREAHGCQ